MFDSNAENPELIWNDAMRNEVRQILRKILNELVKAQQQDPNSKWNPVKIIHLFNFIKFIKNSVIGENQYAYGGETTGEIMIGGVFLRLFIANPSWTVRNVLYFLNLRIV